MARQIKNIAVAAISYADLVIIWEVLCVLIIQSASYSCVLTLQSGQIDITFEIVQLVIILMFVHKYRFLFLNLKFRIYKSTQFILYYQGLYYKFKNHILQMKKKMNLIQLIWIFAVILSLAQAQDATTYPQIQINQIYQVSLIAKQIVIYTLTLANSTNEKESLFVQVQSPYNDPYQEPLVIVTSDNNYQQTCNQNSNQFSGICLIQPKQLKANRKFNIQIACQKQCKLKFSAYLNDLTSLNFGYKYKIQALVQFGIVKQLQIQIPLDLQFTQIAILAKIQNLGYIQEGMQMYVNVGDKNIEIPSQNKYNFKGAEVWGDRTGIFLSKQDIKAGDYIKIYMIIGQGLRLQFYSQLVNGNQYAIELNTGYDDFTTFNQNRVYLLNLSDIIHNNTDFSSSQSVQIVFTVYSGDPEVNVAFDSNFTNEIDNSYLQGIFSFLITPQIRAENNFADTIYIKVSSYWSCNYYFITSISSNEYTYLNQGISFIDQTQPGQIRNYIYSTLKIVQVNQSLIFDFNLKVTLINGGAQVGIQRCKSLETNYTLECLVKNASELALDQENGAFSEIQTSIRQQFNTYQIYFSYDFSQCPILQTFSIYSVHSCQFNIVILPAQLSLQSISYSIDVYSRSQILGLKEGNIMKHFVFKEQYLYYRFDLPNLDQVEQVVFYLTLIAGDACIMATTNQKFKYMQLDMTFKNDDIRMSLYNSIIFQKSKLSSSFFIGVFGYDAAQFTLSVTVKRSQHSNSTNSSATNGSIKNDSKQQQVTVISLKKQLTQQYTIQKNQTLMKFKFQVEKSAKYTVQIVQIQGAVTSSVYQLVDKKVLAIDCDSTDNKDHNKCTFTAQPNVQYFIDVKGQNNSNQIFSISYYQTQSCKRYLLNLPQFIYLAPKQIQCTSFSINPRKSLTIMTSFSTIDILTTNITFSVTINNSTAIQFKGRQRTFSIDQISNLCKSSGQNNCQMKIIVKGDQTDKVQFNYVVQEDTKQGALFDGIVRKVIDQNMSKTKGKFFYYGVSQGQESVKVFLTSKDNVGYYIGAKFVEQDKFLASSDNLYLPFDYLDKGDLLVENQNVFETNLRAQVGTSVLFIPAQDYKPYCTYCVLLISVYGLNDSSKSANFFQIQVTQKQGDIYLGMQKIGFLSQAQIYIYQISANPDQQSLLNIRDLHQESLKDNACFSVDIEQKQSGQVWSIHRGYEVLKKSNKKYRIYIQSQVSQICSYQISYSTLNSPVSGLSLYMSAQIDNRDYSISYYLYFHNSNQSFQLLQYIKSGQSKLYCNRIDINNTIQALLQKNVQLFQFKSKPANSFLQVQATLNQTFCVNCYYLIAVKGDPNVVSELIVGLQSQPIGLSTYGLLKQSLKQSAVQNYVFYSIYTFNISISLIYGQISLQIKGPDGKSLYNSKISMSTQIVVPHSNLTDGQYFDYYDQASQFKIKIKAQKDCAYYVTARKRNVTMRIYQGVPIKFQTINNQTILEFINIGNQTSLSMLLQVAQKVDSIFDLSLQAEVVIEESTNGKKLPLNIKKKTRSQNSFNFQLDSVKGTYFITIKASKPVKLSAILANRKLTHLISTAVNLFTDQGIFEIYTPGKNLMIVIESCVGEVQVKASNNYTKLLSDQDDQIILQHANFGGHYIISAQNVEGQYFIKTSSKIQNKTIGYLISYYYYNKGDVIPYKKLDVVPQISYELTSEQIKFILNPVQLLSSKALIKIQPTYELYIGNSESISKLNAKCGIQTGFSLSKTVSQSTNQKIIFALTYKQIQDIIGKQTGVYFVSAKARVKLTIQGGDSNYPSFIDLAYTSTELTQSHHKVQFKEEDNLRFVLMWIVVPFVISAFMFIIALKFCIKKYRELYPTQLVQQDVNWGQTDEAIHNPNSDSIQYKA